VTCACGNAARYVVADGRLTCALCPLRAGVDSIRLADVPALLAWARRYLADVAESQRRESARMNPALPTAWPRALAAIVGKDVSQP
jgi:hypothetical protein